MAKPEKISLMDIAQLAGCSVATASKVLNQSQGSSVREKTRLKIEEIARLHHYLPNRHASLFSSGKTGQIAFVIPHEIFTDFNWSPTAVLSLELYRGAVERFSESNYMTNLIFSPASGGADFLRKEFLSDRRIDGMVILAGREELSTIRDFENQGIPVISFDWQSDQFNVSHVLECPEQGIVEAVAEARRLGHRRAACISFAVKGNVKHITARKEIFLRECRTAGIECRDEWVRTAGDQTGSYLDTRRILALPGTKPTLFFYTADNFAMLGIKAIQEENLQVPGDISVIGIDDAPFAASSPVPLATVRMPRGLQGRTGAELLLEAIENSSLPQTKRSVAIPSVFIPRQSLGQCRNITTP